MTSINYTISYNKQIQMLEFKHKVLLGSNSRVLAMLFNNFGYNLANIIAGSYNLAVYFVSKPGYNAIFYGDSIPCNEKITDILFLHEKYSDYKNHYPGFFFQEDFVCWQDVIKGIDKPVLLKMLYQDKKISEEYFLKNSVYNPLFLYSLAKSSLLMKLFTQKVFQTEKIDQLPLPHLIKEDIKRSFSRF